MSVRVIDNGPLCSMLAGLQARLQIAFPPSVFTFDVMPTRITQASWAQVVRRTPFVGLGWNSAENKGGSTFAGAAHFSVFLVVKNEAGERGRLMGDSQGSGLFQVVQAAILVLNGFKVPDLADPGATVGTCLVRLASNAGVEWAAENMAVAVIDVDVQGLDLAISRSLQGAEATPDLWNEVASGWVFPDSGDAVQVSDDYTFGATQ